VVPTGFSKPKAILDILLPRNGEIYLPIAHELPTNQAASIFAAVNS
jgi:hypothetical protein